MTKRPTQEELLAMLQQIMGGGYSLGEPRVCWLPGSIPEPPCLVGIYYRGRFVTNIGGCHDLRSFEQHLRRWRYSTAPTTD